jgi:hypothetical protein
MSLTRKKTMKTRDHDGRIIEDNPPMFIKVPRRKINPRESAPQKIEG